jgi:hypothetical protein
LCSDSFASLEEFSLHECPQIKTEDFDDSLGVVVKTEPSEEGIRGYSLEEAEAILNSEESAVKTEEKPRSLLRAILTEEPASKVKSESNSSVKTFLPNPLLCVLCEKTFAHPSQMKEHFREHPFVPM